MSKSTSFLYQLARAANDWADVSASCAFKFDEWRKFVQGINKADERFKRVVPD